MSSILDLFCTARSFVIDLSYSYLYLHDLCPAVSDIDFMISLLYYYILCMVRQTILVYLYLLRYSYVYSSMMYVHPKGGDSTWDISVSLINVGMVSGLNKCCWMSTFPTVCRGSLQVVAALFCAIATLHIRLGGVGGS